MGLLNWLSTSAYKSSKIHAFVGVDKHGYNCAICGVVGSNKEIVAKHLLEIHPEYMLYSDSKGKLPEIAISSWLSVYYVILFRPPKTWTKQEVDQNMGITRTVTIPKIITDVRRIEINGKQTGYLNPYVGKSTIWANEDVKKAIDKGNGLSLTFRRVWTCKSEISKEFKTPEFLIRFREGGRRSTSITDKTSHFKDVINEKLVYGYSPIDFIPDRLLFTELDNAFSAFFGIPTVKDTQVFLKFNDKKEPTIQARLSTLFLEHRVEDRLKLLIECPEIEKACFRDKGILDFIEHCRANTKNIMNADKWLKAVDKLLKDYPI